MITGEAVALGFQHYILALGTAVMIPTFLVPLMGGSDVSPFIFSSLFLCFYFVSSILSKKLIKILQIDIITCTFYLCDIINYI